MSDQALSRIPMVVNGSAAIDHPWRRARNSWRGRDGIRSIIRADQDDVPARFQGVI